MIERLIGKTPVGSSVARGNTWNNHGNYDHNADQYAVG